MKTYVLMLSKYFPMSHHKAGKETNFKTKIEEGSKIHTIRANYPLWEKRIREVHDGEALISLRQWEGRPYKSKQVEITRLTKADGVGIEVLNLPATGSLASVLDVYNELDTNDGLSRLDWMNWFESYERNKPMAIIHFTAFRYKKH